jgi:hypothetical protein
MLAYELILGQPAILNNPNKNQVKQFEFKIDLAEI